MPSLHVAWATWSAVAVITAPRSRWRHLAWLYPWVTVLVVLASASHFLLDAASGLAVLGLGLLGTAGKQRRPCDRHRGAAARQDPAGRGAPPMSTVTITARPTAGAGPAGAPRTAFVLAGGAALGAMQAGMVHALYERAIVPDLLVGTSAGALNAAFLASRPPTVATAEELAALWRGLRRSDILPLRPATLLSGLAGRRDHLIPDRALRLLAARHLQFGLLEQAAIPLHLVAFDLLAGTEVRLSDGPAV